MITMSIKQMNETYITNGGQATSSNVYIGTFKPNNKQAKKSRVHCASDGTDNFSTHHLLITIIGRALTNAQSFQSCSNHHIQK